MRADARKEKFEYVEVYGEPALFTNGRVSRFTVPEGWYCYDLRGRDDDPGNPAVIKRCVMVNHAGTILTPTEIPFKDGKTFVKVDEALDFVGGDMTLEEFCAELSLEYPRDTRKYVPRPASPSEAGLFYAQQPEQDELLGSVGHLRMDFGNGGDKFWTTWFDHGSGKLNTPEFKAEIDEVVNELRQTVLKDREAMRSYCSDFGGELGESYGEGHYGYVVETERYRYCLRCKPREGDYDGYLWCFDKQVQEMNQAKDLKITDFLGKEITLRPRLELYSVKDIMGTERPGLSVVLDEVGDSSADLGQYAVLTVSFGEFIGIKNSAYIDTNNCHFANQLLEQGIAENTGFTKDSGFCQYPLWVFKEDFLREIGSENYEKYAQAYEQAMKIFDVSEPELDLNATEQPSAMGMGGLGQ